MSRFAAISAILSCPFAGALHLRKSGPYDAEQVPHWKTPYELEFVSKVLGTDGNGNPYTAITYNLSTDLEGPALNHTALIIDPACGFKKVAKYSSNSSWQILNPDKKTDDLPVIKSALWQDVGQWELRTIALEGTVELCKGTYVVKEDRDGVESYSETFVPCCCDPSSSTCTIYGDPHVTTFDGSRVSLLRKPTEPVITAETKMEGDVWLVRSKTISIQGQYLPDESTRTENLYLKSVAAGGRWMNGNVLIVGALDQKVLWNGEEVLQQPGTTLELPGLIRVVHNANSTSVKDGSHRAALEISLPNSVNLKINRLRHHVNLQVDMPHASTGAQDGICGNFNGQAGDDELFMLTGPRDPKVLASETLFAA